MKYFRFSTTIASVFVVPLLSFHVLGWLTLAEWLRNFIIVPWALASSFSVVVTVLSGQATPIDASAACPWCGGHVRPKVQSFWCDACKREIVQQPTASAATGSVR